MGALNRLQCSACAFTVEYHEDGHPYVNHPPGTRSWLRHPGEPGQLEEIARDILSRAPTGEDLAEVMRTLGGIAADYICPTCATVSILDPRTDPLRCKRCPSSDLVPIATLPLHPCPKCKSPLLARRIETIS